jgi:hypothetical protein
LVDVPSVLYLNQRGASQSELGQAKKSHTISMMVSTPIMVKLRSFSSGTWFTSPQNSWFESHRQADR